MSEIALFVSIVPKSCRDKRLDQALAKILSDAGLNCSRGEARRLVDAGHVAIQGRVVRAQSRKVRPGQLLEAAYQLQEEIGDYPWGWQLSDAHISYRDRDLIVVNKPAGLASQDTPRGDDNLYAALLRRFATNNERIGLHHRLDRHTSGLLIFTLRPRANAPLAQAFRERGIKKRYQFITLSEGEASQWQCEEALEKHAGGSRPSPRGKTAKTRFETIEAGPGWRLVAAFPETGRLHQVRVHAALSGAPVLGDNRYGQRAPLEALPKAMMLHAEAIQMQHPTQDKVLEVKAPLPEHFVAALEFLRSQGATQPSKRAPN